MPGAPIVNLLAPRPADFVILKATLSGFYQTPLETLFSEEVAHRRGTRLSRAVRAAGCPSCAPSRSSTSPISPLFD